MGNNFVEHQFPPENLSSYGYFTRLKTGFFITQLKRRKTASQFYGTFEISHWAKQNKETGCLFLGIQFNQKFT
jgi:hypothetical protein